jgi:hypothetical protein
MPQRKGEGASRPQGLRLDGEARSPLLAVRLHLHRRASARRPEALGGPDGVARFVAVVARGAVASGILSGHDRPQTPPARSSQPSTVARGGRADGETWLDGGSRAVVDGERAVMKLGNGRWGWW